MGSSFLKKLKMISIGSAMADMALLLLVFFMVTTTSEPPQGVEVKLPKAVTSGADQDSLYVTITAGGDVYFDSIKVNLRQLGDQVAMRAGESDRVVAVTADKDLSYGKVWEVLEVFRSHNFLNVVFMSEMRKK